MKKTNPKILEIGSGAGFNSNLLSKRGEVVGVDLSSDNISQAQKAYPHITFKQMNVEHIDFPDECFDEVHAMDILEHVDDLDQVLAEVKRVLKKNGEFIVNVPGAKSEEWLLKIRPTYFEEIHHVRIFRGNELQDKLESIGFKMKKKSYWGFLQHIELWYLFTRKKDSTSQLSIVGWRYNWISKMLHAGLLFMDPLCLQTPLKFFPIWVITIPFGQLIDKIGSFFFPKSVYYKFKKL